MLSLQQIDDRLADAVGLLLAYAAAVSGARYTDAARYSSLALDAPTAAAA